MSLSYIIILYIIWEYMEIIQFDTW